MVRPCSSACWLRTRRNTSSGTRRAGVEEPGLLTRGSGYTTDRFQAGMVARLSRHGRSRCCSCFSFLCVAALVSHAAELSEPAARSQAADVLVGALLSVAVVVLDALGSNRCSMALGDGALDRTKLSHEIRAMLARWHEQLQRCYSHAWLLLHFERQQQQRDGRHPPPVPRVRLNGYACESPVPQAALGPPLHGAAFLSSALGLTTNNVTTNNYELGIPLK